MFFLKRTFRLALCGLFLFIGSTLAQDISVQLDGRTLQFDQPPARVGGRLMVPLRGIFEALKADVVYDGPTRSIQATKGSRVVQLQLGSRTAIIDGRTLFLDVPADTIGGRTMVPLRFVAEALGADVKWEGATKTVKLSSTGGATANTNPSPPPPATVATGGPKIERVFHNATTALQSGNNLDVVLYGDPGGKATFEILGATNQIGIPEVSPGKYQLRWTIPNGLEVERGVLLAHLQKNGRETAVEAQRQVTVRRAAVVTPPPAQPTWAVSPKNGEVSRNNRPAVSLTFPQDVQPGTLRFFVDGVDFSRQVRLNGRQLTWQPPFNLNTSQHKVEVSARSPQGRQMAHNWSFRVDPNAAPQNQSGGFQISEVRPKDGASVGPRAQVGAIFSKPIRQITFYVDGQLLTNQPGVNRVSNGILWNPTADLTPGQHRASVKAADQLGQVVTKNWNFVVGNTRITKFTVSPTQAAAGQNVTVSLQGPAGSTGTFSVGQVTNLALREISPGRYQGTYTVRPQDQGTAVVSANLRRSNGQGLSANSPNRLTFRTTSQLSVSNLRNGMVVPPVFNCQGSGQPGSAITVLVEYSSVDLVGAISGRVRSFRTQGTVRTGGTYDVPIDASVIKSGQNFRLTVSDGQSQPVQVTLRRQ